MFAFKKATRLLLLQNVQKINLFHVAPDFYVKQQSNFLPFP